MQYLIDTGVLLRLFAPSDAEHPKIRTFFREARSRGHSLTTMAQNISEFWNVSTRPTSARGGYGLDIPSTERRVKFIETMGTILSDSAGAYQRWRELVVKHQVTGVAVHDARLVAVMEVLSISTIVTLNCRDFKRYSQIVAITPEQALATLT